MGFGVIPTPPEGQQGVGIIARIFPCPTTVNAGVTPGAGDTRLGDAVTSDGDTGMGDKVTGDSRRDLGSFPPPHTLPKGQWGVGIIARIFPRPTTVPGGVTPGDGDG